MVVEKSDIIEKKLNSIEERLDRIEKRQKELKGVDKIVWYLLGPLKFVVVCIIFLFCLVFGVIFFQFLQKYILFELALVISFLIFFLLAIGLVMLLNKKRLVERITEDIF